MPSEAQQKMADVMAELQDLVEVIEFIEPADDWVKGTDAADLLFPNASFAPEGALQTGSTQWLLGPSGARAER